MPFRRRPATCGGDAVAPPWKEIYANDDMRRATFAQAESFSAEVIAAYDRLGYEMIELAKTSAKDRARFIISHLRRGARDDPDEPRDMR